MRGESAPDRHMRWAGSIGGREWHRSCRVLLTSFRKQNRSAQSQNGPLMCHNRGRCPSLPRRRSELGSSRLSRRRQRRVRTESSRVGRNLRRVAVASEDNVLRHEHVPRFQTDSYPTDKAWHRLNPPRIRQTYVTDRVLIWRWKVAERFAVDIKINRPRSVRPPSVLLVSAIALLSLQSPHHGVCR